MDHRPPRQAALELRESGGVAALQGDSAQLSNSAHNGQRTSSFWSQRCPTLTWPCQASCSPPDELGSERQGVRERSGLASGSPVRVLHQAVGQPTATSGDFTATADGSWPRMTTAITLPCLAASAIREGVLDRAVGGQRPSGDRCRRVGRGLDSTAPKGGIPGRGLSDDPGSRNRGLPGRLKRDLEEELSLFEL